MGGGAWVVKLKGHQQVDAAEYRRFIDRTLLAYQKRRAAAEKEDDDNKGGDQHMATPLPLPRIVWTYWGQGENDASLGDRARLCVIINNNLQLVHP